MSWASRELFSAVISSLMISSATLICSGVLPLTIWRYSGKAIAPSLGFTKPSGAPSSAQNFQMPANHGAICASPVTTMFFSASFVVGSARMFRACSVHRRKPGSMLCSLPPLSRAARTRGTKLLSKNVTLPCHFGSHSAVHDVGGSLTRFLLYMSPTWLTEKPRPRLPGRRRPAGSLASAGMRAGSIGTHMSSVSPRFERSTLKYPKLTSGALGLACFAASIFG